MVDSLKHIVDFQVSSFTVCVLQRSGSTEFCFQLIQPNIRFRFVAKDVLGLKLN